MKIIDLHCDTIMRFRTEHLRGMENSHIELKKLRDGETLAQCFAIWVPYNQKDVKETPEEYYDRAYEAYLREMELCKDEILPAYTVADVERNDAAGKMSSILTVEDSVTLNGKLENVDRYYEQGVRMVTLTWNYENSVGFPQSMDPEKHMLGLKPFGIEAVRRMNELGIAVDVSHLSEGGFWDVHKHSSKPFIASHSCARALCDVGRNLTDEQLRALADKGGVVGINYYSRFLYNPGDMKNRDYSVIYQNYRGESGDDYTPISVVVEHLKHMYNVGGADILALGSDYDGMGSTLEWKDAGGQQLLVRELEKHFKPDVVEKICCKNAMRALRDIIG